MVLLRHCLAHCTLRLRWESPSRRLLSRSALVNLKQRCVVPVRLLSFTTLLGRRLTCTKRCSGAGCGACSSLLLSAKCCRARGCGH